MRGPLERIADVDPFFLSHHPRCEYYDHHTFSVRGHELCMGCFIVYPVGLASLLVLAAAQFAVPTVRTAPVLAFYAAGFGLAGPLIAYKALYKVGNRHLAELLYHVGQQRVRIATKASLAVGLAFLAYPVVFRPAIRLPAFLLFAVLLVAYVAYKGLTAFDECDACPEQPDFPDCTGLNFEAEE